MSLAGKIYGIVVLLVIIALAIAGVGVYGISSINERTDQLGRIANRAVALNRMDRTSLARSEGAARIIIASSPEDIKGVVETMFLPSEKTWRRNWIVTLRISPTIPRRK